MDSASSYQREKRTRPENAHDKLQDLNDGLSASDPKRMVSPNKPLLDPKLLKTGMDMRRKNTKVLELNAVDEEDDMFSDSFAIKGSDAPVNTPKNNNGVNNIQVRELKGGGDAKDDDEGYYDFSIGEVLNGEWEVLGYFGKGVYSNVIRAKRLKKSHKSDEHPMKMKAEIELTKSTISSSEQSADHINSQNGIEELTIYAIKLLRNNAHMKRSGKKELKILNKLDQSDPESKHNTIKLISHFESKGHLCLVFEAMDLNMTEVVKKYGHGIGLSIKAVRNYAFKLFKSLSLLEKCNIIHADIKPDNILVSKDRTVVKLADFGTAFESQEEIFFTQDLVSRYYRAPEIILGYPLYSFPIDMFSMGCSLYEMATGKYLLPSNNDNHHLLLILQITGPFSKKFLSQSNLSLVAQHFTNPNDGSAFLERYEDPLDNSRYLVRQLDIPSKPTRNLSQELVESYGDSVQSPTEAEWVVRLGDLITKCITADPRKRITPMQALQHSFF